LISKSFLVVISLLSLCLFPALAVAGSVPQVGDSFSYYEVQDLGSGTGNYSGYSEQTTVNGNESINGVGVGGIVSANYMDSWIWNDNLGSSDSGSSSGNFTFSSITLLYVNGTDDQNGYVNPTVWFLMNSSIPNSGTFYILNTEMTVLSTNYSYYLPSQDRYVKAIFAEGSSSYQRNDQYGVFTATYTWDEYFDPSTGYIIGYDYEEHDIDPSGNGFTYTDSLYVTATSYPLITGAPSNPGGVDLGPLMDAVFIAGMIFVIVFIIILIYALTRRKKAIPRHPSQQVQWRDRGTVLPPQNIDLTPDQPPVQQIVIKETVKVKCKYCGTLIDSTAQVCPRCGAPRT